MRTTRSSRRGSLPTCSLFRHAPHILRPKIYNDQAMAAASHGSGLVTRAARRHSSGERAAVLGRIFATRMTTAVDEPLYKFLHVGIPHRPVVVTSRL